MDEMKYLTELAVREYYFSTHRASTIALAAILNAISDTCTKERREVLGAYLGVITECFDFDGSEQITAARRRLHTPAMPETEEDEIIDDERSLEESVMTLKASNSSSSSQKRKRDPESQKWYGRRDGLGHEHERIVSPSSSLLDSSC